MATLTTPATAPKSPTAPKQAPAKGKGKTPAPAKGAKVARGVKGQTPAVKTAWNAGKKVIHHAVKVGKDTFPSCWQAFKALKLIKAEDDYGPCVKFRKALKANGKTLEYDPGDGKKKIKFELIAKA